jgi:hypothetical protein
LAVLEQNIAFSIARDIGLGCGPKANRSIIKLQQFNILKNVYSTLAIAYAPSPIRIAGIGPGGVEIENHSINSTAAVYGVIAKTTQERIGARATFKTLACRTADDCITSSAATYMFDPGKAIIAPKPITHNASV